MIDWSQVVTPEARAAAEKVARTEAEREAERAEAAAYLAATAWVERRAKAAGKALPADVVAHLKAARAVLAAAP